MFALNDIQKLTVYNGTEEKYSDEEGNRLLPARCCDEGSLSNSVNVAKQHCKFQNDSTEEMKVCHRQLIIGEPFKQAGNDNLDGTLSWTPISAVTALGRAVDIISESSGFDQLLRDEFPYTDDHLYTAVSLVRTFIQLNYTGPDISCAEVKEKLEQLESLCKQKDLQQHLEVDGIEVDGNIQQPALLIVAMRFLNSLKTHSLGWPFYLIWRFRIDFLHQRILTRRSLSLSRQLKFFAERYINWVSVSGHLMTGSMADVHGSFLCEIAEMLVYYYDGLLSERILDHAMEVLELTVEFSGKMGYRTKFQQTPKPQTVVNIVSNSAMIETNRPFSSIENCIPKSEALNDDTRLDRLRLVDDEVQQSYKDVHQLVLLGKMLHKQGFQGEDELKRQEEEALINVIIDCPVNWSGRLSALVARCRLEKYDRRAIDRTLRQIEEISKLMSRRVEATDEIVRQYLFFGCGHPLKSEIKMLFGEVLLSLEHWKEALRLYSELGAFDKIVRCYEMMNLRHKAEELVRERIAETGKTPKLLVLLGDVTSDVLFYEEAWSLSSGKSVDSQIRLGNYHFRREEFPSAITYLQRAVELAPLEYPCWIRLAWACYKTEDYETAFQAYLRAANLEYDNFQVWNNLANCALKLNRKDYALRAYKVAVKCNYDEWRVWSNILIVATELDVLTDSIQAYHRILDLNKSFVDEAVLDKMVNSAAKTSNVTTIASVAKLFGRITATTSRSAIVWLMYGKLLASYLDCNCKDCDDGVKTNNFERAMHYYDKALNLMRQNPTWKTDLVALQNVVNCITEFRECREKGRPILDNESNNRLKGLDSMLRQTAMSVYGNLKKLIEEIPTQNEKLQSIFGDITEEIKHPFYA